MCARVCEYLMSIEFVNNKTSSGKLAPCSGMEEKGLQKKKKLQRLKNTKSKQLQLFI